MQKIILGILEEFKEQSEETDVATNEAAEKTLKEAMERKKKEFEGKNG